jgi:hypothetical protein
VSELDKRTRRSANAWWMVGALIAMVACESSSTFKVRNGEVETAEFTIPIPEGHTALSRAEVVERSSKHPPAENLVVMLIKPGTGGISIARVRVRSKGSDAPAAVTMEECAKYLAKVTAERGDPVVVGATLVEHSAAGLGTACMFTVASSPAHMTQITTSDWMIVCGHPPGESAACEQVAAGFRRR